MTDVHTMLHCGNAPQEARLALTMRQADHNLGGNRAEIRKGPGVHAFT
jgi:hypothetical protein